MSLTNKIKIKMSDLQKIIKEELEDINEFAKVADLEAVTGGEARTAAQIRAREMSKAGITSPERAVIKAVEEKLMAAAQEGKIDTGRIAKFLEQYVFPALDKIIGEPEVAPEAEIEPEL